MNQIVVKLFIVLAGGLMLVGNLLADGLVKDDSTLVSGMRFPAGLVVNDNGNVAVGGGDTWYQNYAPQLLDGVYTCVRFKYARYNLSLQYQSGRAYPETVSAGELRTVKNIVLGPDGTVYMSGSDSGKAAYCAFDPNDSLRYYYLGTSTRTVTDVALDDAGTVFAATTRLAVNQFSLPVADLVSISDNGEGFSPLNWIDSVYHINTRFRSAAVCLDNTDGVYWGWSRTDTLADTTATRIRRVNRASGTTTAEDYVNYDSATEPELVRSVCFVSDTGAGLDRVLMLTNRQLLCYAAGLSSRKWAINCDFSLMAAQEPGMLVVTGSDGTALLRVTGDHPDTVWMSDDIGVALAVTPNGSVVLGMGDSLKYFGSVYGDSVLANVQVAQVHADFVAAFLNNYIYALGFGGSDSLWLTKLLFYPPTQKAAERCVGYVAGDVDSSGAVNVSDLSYLVEYLFSGGSEPFPKQAGNADGSDDCLVSVADVTRLANFLFSGGAAPKCPPCAPWVKHQ